jgi:formamidopyrimidine-DNA glycosylase
VPEFPEVYTIVFDLNREIQGKKIDSIKIFDEALARPSKEKISSLVGNTVLQVTQIGKNIVLNLPCGGLVFHLRMTGRLLYRNIKDVDDPYTRLVFSFGDSELRFCEMRRFGYAQYLSKEEVFDLSKRYELGVVSMSYRLFRERVATKNTIIKRLLLDQNVVSGLGNIYANEALFLAKIHPERTTKSLSEEETLNLFNAIKTVINQGISYRGSTLLDKSYVDIYGRPGAYQNYFKVYGKQGNPCPFCKTNIVAKQIAQRGSFFCPRCQFLPTPATL